MRELRTFYVSLYHGEGNCTRTRRVVESSTPYDAALNFLNNMPAMPEGAGEPFPGRYEQPTLDSQDRLWSWMSFGAPAFGQRIWVKWQTGGSVPEDQKTRDEFINYEDGSNL